MVRKSNYILPREKFKQSHFRESIPYLPIFQFNIKEIEVPKDSELLFTVWIIHVLLLPCSVFWGHQACLVLNQIQITTRRKNNLQFKGFLFWETVPSGCFLVKAVIGYSEDSVFSTHLIPSADIFRTLFYYLCWTGAFRLNLNKDVTSHCRNVSKKITATS